LLSCTTEGGDTAIGFDALLNNTTGVTNTALGLNAGFNITTADSVIVIGTSVGGQNVDIAPLSARSSVQPLPMELLFSLIQTGDLAP
jgi:hypothetical protein